MTRRSLSRLLLAAAAIAALAAPAQAAAVDDIRPTASVSTKLGGKARECVAGRCGYMGGRKLTVTWNTNCNVSDPNLNRSVFVTLKARPKRAGAKPVAFEDILSDEDLAASGTADTVVPAGMRAFAEVAVECSYTTYDADSNSIEHKGTGSAASGDVFLPPALTGFNFPRGAICGVNLPSKKLGVTAQAGQYATLHYLLRYSPFALLPKTGVAGEAAGIRLHGSGAGLRFKAKPERRGLRRGEYETFIKPRRGGTLKIWATIGGVKTNTLKIKVLPKRC